MSTRNQNRSTNNPPASAEQSLAADIVADLARKPAAEAVQLVAAMPADQVTALTEAWKAEQLDQCRAILGLQEEGTGNPGSGKRETETAAPVPPAPAKKRQGRDEPTPKVKIKAGPCAKVAAHTNTRVYKTLGAVRYCVCDDCGHTWKKAAQPAAEPALAVV